MKEERTYKNYLATLTYAQALRERSKLQQLRRMHHAVRSDAGDVDDLGTVNAKLTWWAQTWLPQLNQRPPWYRRIRWTSIT